MGVAVSDFICGQISDKAIARACQYAQVSLTRTFNRMGSPYFDKRLRRIVIGLAAESVFMDWLKENGIPHSLSGRTRWYEVDRYDIGIHGYRCDVKSLWTDQFPSDLNRILDWCVLVPVDQVHHKKESADIYIFAFVSGKLASSTQTSMTLSLIGQNYRWLTHVPWNKQWWNRSQPLGHLRCYAIAHEDEGKEIELGGTMLKDNKRITFQERIRLSRTKTRTRHEFHELLYVKCVSSDLPVGTIIVESEQLREEIPPYIGFIPNEPRQLPPKLNGWYDIWLYDAVTIIVGLAFRSDVLGWQQLPHHSRCDPVAATQTTNYYARVRQLRPLSDLFKLS